MKNRRPTKQHRRGYSLVELIVSMAIMAVGLGVVANVMVTYTQGARVANRQTAARALADSLMAEIMATPNLGYVGPGALDPHEPRLDKTNAYRFIGWDSPVCSGDDFGSDAVYPVMPHVRPDSCNGLSDVVSPVFRDYRRTVEISCVEPMTLNVTDCTASDDLLRITVVVRYDNQWVYDIVSYKSRRAAEAGL